MWFILAEKGFKLWTTNEKYPNVCNGLGKVSSGSCQRADFALILMQYIISIGLLIIG